MRQSESTARLARLIESRNSLQSPDRLKNVSTNEHHESAYPLNTVNTADPTEQSPEVKKTQLQRRIVHPVKLNNQSLTNLLGLAEQPRKRKIESKAAKSLRQLRIQNEKLRSQLK